MHGGGANSAGIFGSYIKQRSYTCIYSWNVLRAEHVSRRGSYFVFRNRHEEERGVDVSTYYLRLNMERELIFTAAWNMWRAQKLQPMFPQLSQSLSLSVVDG